MKKAKDPRVKKSVKIDESVLDDKRTHTIASTTSVAKCGEQDVHQGSSAFSQSGYPFGVDDDHPPCATCLRENLKFIKLHDEEFPNGPWVHEYVSAVPGTLGVHLSDKPGG